MKPSVPKGTVSAPPSKSYTHRAMVLGALTHGQFSLRHPLSSEDTKATLDALYALGTEFRTTTDGLAIHCEKLRRAVGTIDAHNSGTTIRLISGVAALLPAKTILTGDESLVKRPMGPLVDALTQLGAKCQYLSAKGKPPLSIEGPMSGGNVDIAGDISSQFVSSLLIACTQKHGETHIKLKTPLRSGPYVDITLEMIREFGGEVEENRDGFHLRGEQVLSLESYTVPGDYSSAAFPLTAAAITGGSVTVRNLEPESTQGDRAIVKHLKSFGAKVTVGKDWVKAEGNHLHGTSVDVRHTPDLFPVLCVLGSVADGSTTVTGGENLREKESDRIASTTSFLKSMGADIVPTKDGCVITGTKKLHGASVKTQGDHRILMAAAVAALGASSETRIDDDSSFSVSYPGFIRDMHQLGCRMAVVR